MTTLQKLKRACRVFPRTSYSDPAAVRHARRQLVKAMDYLRDRPEGSIYILDKRVTRQ